MKRKRLKLRRSDTFVVAIVVLLHERLSHLGISEICGDSIEKAKETEFDIIQLTFKGGRVFNISKDFCGSLPFCLRSVSEYVGWESEVGST